MNTQGKHFQRVKRDVSEKRFTLRANIDETYISKEITHKCESLDMRFSE